MSGSTSRYGRALTLAVAVTAISCTSITTPASAATRARSAVLREAAALKGLPYRWGGNGPHSFDCSGYARFVFWHADRLRLPRIAADQYRHAHHESHRSIRPGDLVFEIWGGVITHVGIYAGGGKMWNATHPGQGIRLSPLPAASHWLAASVLP